VHTSKKSIIGRALARFFCGLLIGSDVGINAKWISTSANKIADEISRIKKSTQNHSSFHYDFSKLQQDHVELKHCCFFQPSQELRLKQGSAIETERFRQAQYLNWCKQKFVPDPCGNEPRYERLVACFIENLMLDCNSRLATAQGYAQSINKLFEYRGFPIPANHSDRKNMTSKIIRMREREENIERQKSPISKEMFVAMANHACD